MAKIEQAESEVGDVNFGGWRAPPSDRAQYGSLSYRVKFLPNDDEEDNYEFKEFALDKLAWNFTDLFEHDKDPAEPNPLRKFFERGSLRSSKPTQIQTLAMPYVLNAEYDIVIRAPTGSGKTYAYAIPIVYSIIKAKRQSHNSNAQRALYAIVAVPTAVLCEQVYAVFKDLCTDTDVTLARSRVGSNIREINDQKNKTGVNIMICEAPHLQHYFYHPENVYEQNNHIWDFSSLRYVVLDEAQELLGVKVSKTTYFNSIQPLLYMVYHMAPEDHEYRLIMVSAHPDITGYAELPFRPHGCLFVEVGDISFPAHRINQEFHLVEDDNYLVRHAALFERTDDLIDNNRVIVPDNKTPRIVIFTKDESTAAQIRGAIEDKYQTECAIVLKGAGGPWSREVQIRNIDRFKDFTTNFLVATDIAADGVNFPAVDYVINYDLPTDFDTFSGRVGRCGRNDAPGHVITYFNPKTDFGIGQAMTKMSDDFPAFQVPKFVRKHVWRKGFAHRASEFLEVADTASR